MAQYQFKDNLLILKVKKAHLILRVILFVLAFTCLVFSLSRGVIAFKQGIDGQIIPLMIAVLMVLVGIQILRMALWNSYGSEELLFEKDKVCYIANYGWFKDGKTEIDRGKGLHFSIGSIGEENEGKGVLVLKNGDQSIDCVTKMDREELREMIGVLAEW